MPPAPHPVVAEVVRVVGSPALAREAIHLVLDAIDQDLRAMLAAVDQWGPADQRDLALAIRIVAERWRILAQRMTQRHGDTVAAGAGRGAGRYGGGAAG